ncbi:alpha/beta hydrolase [Antarcticibacterium arcticum]|uniref:Alpha/beta hydrolase n=1 Tax=Antarcticibacterium arcticum TaxID=2585771 RepID=A0A5B8YHU4_9FLAO|nr:alpha/beta hydrolase [Antarcticibacterium arcticum]QED36407.1 alpha/beta hydrolase [Antarcticibacterium arcticum]
MKTLLFTFILFTMGISARGTEKRIITSDGIDLYVKVKGEGTPVLYLHGGPGSGSFWFEKFFGEFMEQNFTVIYLDQRGVGRSTGDKDDDYSMERMALDFEEVRIALGFDSWLTIGHSFGGILQAGYASLYPNAHKGMIMVNGTLSLVDSFCNSWGPKAAEFTGKNSQFPCDTPENIKANLGAHINNLREQDLFWKMAFREASNEKIVDATINEVPGWNWNFGSLALDQESYWKDYRGFTREIKVPVLFFYGDQDWMVGPEHYKGINFPNMMLWASPGGHFPFIENKEELEASILAYKTNYVL